MDLRASLKPDEEMKQTNTPSTKDVSEKDREEPQIESWGWTNNADTVRQND
ncbi:hypothetical protein [uncultured Brevibacillus sp.]|uniref:hypothetical protein n=1 Tax=uncultured Brevibacillus sp. TaxID=169970 RepID=UPI0025943FD9|nr:hypothetical protein [uncultured Brevibacillus sp.]